MWLRDVIYAAYERRLARHLRPESIPRHIGILVDGNRRWAQAYGTDTSEGYRAGAANVLEFLSWCDEVGVQVVTLWLLSTDNLSRPSDELTALFTVIDDLVSRIAATGRWRVHPVGSLDLLPATLARSLKEREDATAGVRGLHVNVAVGYGGRREI